MSFAPKQNWPAYNALVESKQIEKDRLIRPAQKLKLYAEIFDSIWSLKKTNQNGNRDPQLETEKMEIRKRLLLAYRNVPEPHRD